MKNYDCTKFSLRYNFNLPFNWVTNQSHSCLLGPSWKSDFIPECLCVALLFQDSCFFVRFLIGVLCTVLQGKLFGKGRMYRIINLLPFLNRQGCEIETKGLYHILQASIVYRQAVNLKLVFDCDCSSIWYWVTKVLLVTYKRFKGLPEIYSIFGYQGSRVYLATTRVYSVLLFTSLTVAFPNLL